MYKFYYSESLYYKMKNDVYKYVLKHFFLIYLKDWKNNPTGH